MISAIKVDLEDNGLGGVHHRTLRSLGWLNYKTSNGSKPKRCQHHQCSFDLVVWVTLRILPQLALLTELQSCTYQLNPSSHGPAQPSC